jgi:ATP adenylyltransferase
MDKLWAPWRGEFVSTLKDGCDCFLCEIGRRSLDTEDFVLYRGKSVYALLNRFPYNTGHLMVVPYEHLGCLSLVSSDVALELHEVTNLALDALRGSMYPHGFNVGYNLGRAAGAGVEGHIHLHIVPRWNGDTNFMPVIAETKVLPHDLPTVHRLITAKWPSRSERM